MKLLSEIVWTFNETVYDTMDKFDEKVQQYQMLILKTKAFWQPQDIIIKASEIDILYTVWTEKDAIAENETLQEDEDFFDNEAAGEDGLFQAEIKARLRSENGKHFTALELLYKTDEQMKTKDLGDHRFFEGFNTIEDQKVIPQFYLNLGS